MRKFNLYTKNQEDLDSEKQGMLNSKHSANIFGIAPLRLIVPKKFEFGEPEFASYKLVKAEFSAFCRFVPFIDPLGGFTFAVWNTETGRRIPSLHTLIPLADFKAVLGTDDREDALSRYCLISAAYSIEQYCKRWLIRKKHTDYLTFNEEHIFTLREYPVRKVLAVWAAKAGTVQWGEPRFGPENLVDPKYYYCVHDEGIREDIPFSLVLRPPIRLSREEMGIRVRYLAGYSVGKAPADLASADLASACLELAA
jgi:hypothetical protein